VISLICSLLVMVLRIIKVKKKAKPHFGGKEKPAFATASAGDGGAGEEVVPHSVLPTLSLSPENNKQAPCGAWRFCFLKSPSESFLSSGLFKNKNPLAGVLVYCFNVELAGVEPASRQGDHMLSTCLFLLDCRDWPGAEQPNRSLSS
jgi:hypothetical protein